MSTWSISPPPGAGASSSASISSSAASLSLRRRRSKNFTPLYSGGLCDAVMTTPRSSAEQRDGGSRDDAGEHRRAAGGRDAARERLLELLARAARVAADEDAAAARPERGRLAEPLDEIGGDELADDAADTVGAEVVPRHGADASAGDVAWSDALYPGLDCGR